MVKFNCTFTESGGTFTSDFNDNFEKMTLTFAESGGKIPLAIGDNLDNPTVTFGSVIEVEKDIEQYSGNYSVTPDAHNEQILQTRNKKLIDDVTVLKVPFYETSNVSGQTVYIASEVI